MALPWTNGPEPNQQHLKLASPGVLVNLSQHLLVSALPGRFLQLVLLHNFQSRALRPDFHIRQLVLGVVPWVRNPQPDGCIGAHRLPAGRGQTVPLGFTRLVDPGLDSPIDELPTSVGESVAMSHAHR